MRGKKFFVLLLAVAIMGAEMVSASYATVLPFTDVTKNWAYNSIVKCYENGWILGTTPTTFSPKDTLTRAQFVTILGRYAGADVKAYTSSSFADVNFNSWGYAPYVAWAEEKGIAHGMDETHFQPGGTVTRAQLVVFLYNYVQYLGAELTVTNSNVSFSDDASIPSYAKKAVATLAGAGVISGINGAFKPGEVCTREMTASFLQKFDAALKKAAYGPDEPQITSLAENSSGNPVLKWNAVPEATGYCVYRREAGSRNWNCIAYWLKTTTYTDITAMNYTTYEYCVRGYIYRSSTSSRLWSPYGNMVSKISVMPVYSISNTSTPYENAWVNSSFYNASTKDYYLIRSYLDALSDGGTLILQAGTYNIPYTLYIPSNVTVKLCDGATINKTADVGNSTAASSGTLFSFVDSQNASVSNAITEYAGVHNSKVVGEGRATITSSYTGSTMFLMGHNDHIEVSGIRFELEDGQSYGMKIYGSRNVTISNCMFSSTKGAAAAVLLEPAGGTCVNAPAKWCGLDETVSTDITVNNCGISGMQYGIYNRYYVSKSYSTGIMLRNIQFDNLSREAVFLKNDLGTVISGCTFTQIGGGAVSSNYSAIHLYGSKAPVIENNIFDQVPSAVMISSNAGSYPVISDSCFDRIISENTAKILYRYYVAVNQSDGTNKLKYFKNDTTEITISPDSTPFQNKYLNYTDETKFYYNMRAALEQMDAVGGGKIIVEAGNYILANELFIPSNTEVVFKDGVTITNKGNLGVMFAFAGYQDLSNGVKYTEYNGVHDSSVHTEKSTDRVVLDNNFAKGAIFEIGHTKNIAIYGLQMENMCGTTHFIELDASYNVSIYRNTFLNCMDMGADKEAINIDVPDPNTEGFPGAYSSQDRTANDSIYIHDNLFKNVPTGIGTHMYTDVSPHTNICVYNNRFEDILYYGVTARNWVSCRIYDNEFVNVGYGGTGDFLGIGTVFMLSGAKNPYITNNFISNAQMIMRIDVMQYSPETITNPVLLQYAVIYNEISEENKKDFFENTCSDVKRPIIYYRNNKNDSIETWYKVDYTANDIELNTASEPYLGFYTDSSSYNEETKMYYVLRSYLEHLDEIGGGTIRLAAGIYPISGMLYIPSNVTIVMDENAIIQNNAYNGILFNLRSQNTALSEAGAYSASENITISGGTIDTAGVMECQPIYIAKANQIIIQNVKFVNGSSYYVRVLSSKNVEISSCTFEGTSDSNAILISNTYDSVPSISVKMDGNTFHNLQRSIATNVQSEAYYQDIQITNCSFDGCSRDAIYLYRMKDLVISHNVFSNMQMPDCYGIRICGADSLEMAYNSFRNMYYCGTILYNQTYGMNTLSDQQKDEICRTNTYDEDVVHPYILFRADSSSSTEKLYDISLLGNSFTVTEDMEPYMGDYTTSSAYNSDTKQFYVLQSYLDLAKRVDGNVTITLQAGTYSYTNTVFIPSNVTLVLSEGAVVKHNNAGTAAQLFVFAESSAANSNIASVDDYAGVKNAAIIGKGIIDLEGQSVYAVTVPKCSGVCIDGITFTGGASASYYIRIWSSQDVTVQNCNFEGNNASSNNGIAVSAYYSNVPCDGVVVQSCSFDGLNYGVYSANANTSMQYHTRVFIDQNTFATPVIAAVYGVGWYEAQITNNVFNGIGNSAKYAVQLYGIVDPQISGNSFAGIDYGIQMSYTSAFPSNSVSDGCKAAMISENDFGSCKTAIIYRQDASTSAVKW